MRPSCGESSATALSAAHDTLADTLNARESLFNTSHPFARRTNPNGTIDSICKTCFATVGTREDADDPDVLRKIEESHVCDSWRLEAVKAALSSDSLFKRKP